LSSLTFDRDIASSGLGPLRRRPLPEKVQVLPLPRPFYRRHGRRFAAFTCWRHTFLGRHVYPRLRLLRRPYSWTLARQLTLGEAELRLPQLPLAWDGITLLQFSDLHAGPFLDPRAFAAVCDALRQLEPDLLLISGDFVDGPVGELEPLLSSLARLGPRLGSFGVLGNHDYFCAAPGEVAALAGQAGIKVLRNEAHIFSSDGDRAPLGRLVVAGTEDLLLGDADLEATLAPAREHDCVILLSHHPDLFFDAARRGVALTLAGHTHGGQIRVPGLPPLIRESRYRLDEGVFEFVPEGSRSASTLVVSRGFGVSGLPLRWGCPPEVLYLTLRRG
jgi:predicted MPP superfamily phosphohydrolase